MVDRDAFCETPTVVDWDALYETPRVVLVPFGKYVGQPLRVLLQDKDYCRWFMLQGDLHAKYPNIAEAIDAGSATLTPTRTGTVRATIHNLFARPSGCYKSIPCVTARCSISTSVSQAVGGQHRRSAWRAAMSLNTRCHCGNKHFVHPDDLVHRAP